QQMFGELSAALEIDPKLTKAEIKLVQLLAGVNQLDKATEHVDKILQREPNNAEAYSSRAMILIRQKKPDEALVQAQKALELKPGLVTASAALASIYMDSDPAKAEQVLADSLKLNPDDIGLRVIQIQVLSKHNKTEEVIAAFKELIAKKPKEFGYTVELANYYIEHQRLDDAEALLRGAIQKQPDNDDAKLRLVEFLGKQRKPELAVTQLEQYVADNPKSYKLRSALARIYAGTNLPDKAIATYQYTIDNNGHDAEGIDARNRVIELLLAQKKRPEAEAQIKEVLKLEPENPDALFIRAQIFLSENDANSAIADLRSILKNSPESVPALSLMGNAQERIGATNLALDNYKKLIQINADNVPALANAARLQLAQNQVDDAQKLLEHARQLAPDNLDVARSLADVYSRKKMWQEALAICEQLQLNSKTASAGFYLAGVVHLQNNEYPPAIDLFKKALDREPRAVEPLGALMTAYFINKQPDVAQTYLEKHVKDHPDQIHAQELLGALYRQTQKYPEAEKVFEGILKQQPGRISSYRELAQVYSAKGNNDQIAALYARGLQQNPDNIELLMLQANQYQATGKNQQALDNYNKMLQLQPNSTMIKNNLATLLIDKFNTAENLQRAETLTAGFADSSNPFFLDTLGWLQYKLKNYPQAISLLENAQKKGGNFAELYYHLGMAYLSNNMVDKAKAELTKATASKEVFDGRAEAESTLKKL
ncbi:MAG TPA: tetratricopeptide repeat protein, partial [Spongiibacteraceae bacterium]|nr:tetratricopeptide repeat protein [Spongiibacteraceae bacterium]